MLGVIDAVVVGEGDVEGIEAGLEGLGDEASADVVRNWFATDRLLSG